MMRNVLVALQLLSAMIAAMFVYLNVDGPALMFLIASIAINCLTLIWPDDRVLATKKQASSDFVVKFKQSGGK